MVRVWHGTLPWPDRFWAKVIRGDGCWLFKGGRNGNGYAVIQIAGHARPAHRIAWELTNGPIPSGLMVLHQCDVKKCVRPDHLKLGTHADNMEDMRVRHRAASGDQNGMRLHPESRSVGDAHWTKRKPSLVARGEANGFAKLNASDIPTIRDRWERGDSLSVIATAFQIDKSTVSKIGRREAWRHVPGPTATLRVRGPKEGRWH